MVPQMPPAGAPAYSQLIPVPSVSAAPKVKAEQQAAAKQEAAAAAAAAKHIVAEVPLTRAERVARCAGAPGTWGWAARACCQCGLRRAARGCNEGCKMCITR